LLAVLSKAFPASLAHQIQGFTVELALLIELAFLRLLDRYAGFRRHSSTDQSRQQSKQGGSDPQWAVYFPGINIDSLFNNISGQLKARAKIKV
jgi:hypothetical protein